MIAEFCCNNNECREVVEEYFPTFDSVPSVKPCPKCGTEMKKLLASPNVRMGGVVSGYEKDNTDNLTLGKAVDMKQRWV